MTDPNPDVPSDREPAPNSVPPPETSNPSPETLPAANEQTSPESNEPALVAASPQPNAEPASAPAPSGQPVRVPTHAVHDPADGPPAPDSAGDVVPFSGPPTERNTKKFTWALVLSLVGGVVVCGGLIAAVVMMTTQLSSAIVDSGLDQADDFMADISQENWDDAYGQLCLPLQNEGTVNDYSADWAEWDASSWTIQDDSVGQTSVGDLLISVEMADGEIWELEVAFEAGEENLLDAVVCGWDQQ